MKSMRSLVCSCALAAAVLVVAGVAAADPPVPTLSRGWRFSEQTGEALFANACQACHMSHAEGAVGAGRYPALAKDANLATAGYVVDVVLHGYKAMPAVGRLMTDEQVAAVVNYLRTHFGNSYSDAVTASDVKNVR
jgi:mono/diheme cytochrome c family protein